MWKDCHTLYDWRLSKSGSIRTLGLTSAQGCFLHVLKQCALNESNSRQVWICTRLKPGSYFLQMQMRYVSCRHKFATNKSQQWSCVQLLRTSSVKTAMGDQNLLCIRRKYEPGFKQLLTRQCNGCLHYGCSQSRLNDWVKDITVKTNGIPCLGWKVYLETYFCIFWSSSCLSLRM